MNLVLVGSAAGQDLDSTAAPTKVVVPAVAVAPAANPPQAEIVGAVPVHELVHSFPLPPLRPSGHLVRDDSGWIWGTTGSGGNYGRGTIYKMRADGSEWREVVSFNGTHGVPRGAGPRGMTLASDGSIWGTTGGGGFRNQGTLYQLDSKGGGLITRHEFDGLGYPCSRPTVAPDGHLWGATQYSVYRFNPATGELTIVLRFTGKTGEHPGGVAYGELVADGRGFFWGVTSKGGASDNGTIYKINIATGEATTVVQFTGKIGPCIGSAPHCGVTPDGQGFLWGTTWMGGWMERGTVFKIHAETGAFSHIADFRVREGHEPGSRPETMLIADGEGSFWGTTNYGGRNGKGTVFKVDALTGRLATVVTFTGIEGDAQGGPSRGDLLADGSGGFFGTCDYGGAGAVGTVYHVEAKTGKFTLLKDLSDLAKTTEGSDPRGTLLAGTGDWLWGVTTSGGAHHCGTIYKFNAVSNRLVSVIDFTGSRGPHKGRSANAGLVKDGHGYLWGTTASGGSADQGTIYKIDETSGAFTTIAEFGEHPDRRGGTAPSSALVADGRGFMWGTNYFTVFKVDIRTHVLTTIARFRGDAGPFYGIVGLGTLALDDRGFLWGCSQALPKCNRACLFKIDTSNDAVITLAEFTEANGGWNGWCPSANMHWDGMGSMWFTGVCDATGRYQQCSLFKVNTRTGAIEASYREPGYAMISAPAMDENGVLWGAALQGGFGSYGSIYTFDTRSLKFATFLNFTGQGAQAKTGQQPQTAQLMKHSDGNFYSVTRMGGPGNGGTVFRLRYGPTPMTQEATLLADGRVALHGTLTPNGLESAAAFEWGTEPTLAQASVLAAGQVPAGDTARPVTEILSGLRPETTYYFRLRGSNAANAIPQRGAVLSFTMPASQVASPDAVLAANKKKDDGTAVGANALLGGKYALKVNRIPGAGAGLVTGALTGPAYEVDRRYSLTALADNDYIFHHWSGPGIRGAAAENVRLSFVFTEALAKAPVITATFVRNPFRGDAVGSFNGLVYAAEGVTPDLSNTGALSLIVTRGGTFTGSLRYDGDTIPLTGVFDTGGLARFGPAGVSPWALVRPGKPVVFLSMQLDLSPAGPHEVFGAIDNASDPDVVDRSVFTASRNYYDGLLRFVPEQYLTAGGKYDLTIFGAANDETSGRMHLTPAGSATFAVKFGDGTDVLAQASLSRAHQAAFFVQLYDRRNGSVGGMITLDDLLQKDASNDQPFWWCRSDQTWLGLTVRGSPTGTAQ
ncbi:MAG: choice-of-anchor tandem repeat GloVer-containing protein [Prosthecobacter sp.]|nr:choice-of-anchor tandem repeat GloVer-containing protein [Prosthecobacter sp.]